MKTFRLLFATLFALALVAFTTSMLWAAPLPTGTSLKAHSQAWHDYYLDQNAATHVTLNVAETPHELWRGGLAENQAALHSIAKPHIALRVAHSQDWDSQYLDRNVNSSIKAIVTDYTPPYLWQGCAANPHHRVPPANPL